MINLADKPDDAARGPWQDARMGTVTDYLAAREGENQKALEHVIAVAREVAPDVTEGESYGMPALLYRGKGFAAAMEAKQHLGLYPFSGSVLPSLADELGDFELVAWRVAVHRRASRSRRPAASHPGRSEVADRRPARQETSLIPGADLHSSTHTAGERRWLVPSTRASGCRA